MRMNWLNYHHLQYFWIVSREGSVARASEILHVTPATISIQLKELESSLGVELFKKAGRGLALTEMGEAVQAYAQDIFSTGQELLDMVHGRPVGGPTVLRVGIKDVMPKVVAYQLLEPTFEVTDNLRLCCYEGDIGKLLADLAIHKLDVVLSDTPIDPSLKVRAYSHLLGESEVSFVAARSIAKKYKKGFPECLNGAPMLLPMSNTYLRRSLEYWFEENGIRPRIVGEFDDSAMLKIMGRAGHGIFPIVSVIRKEVESMYGVEWIADIPHLTEKFYAISVERKVKHPAVLRITEQARRRFAISP